MYFEAGILFNNGNQIEITQKKNVPQIFLYNLKKLNTYDEDNSRTAGLDKRIE